MSLQWFIEDAPQYVSRGERVLSVLDGSGSVDIIPGRPDVEAKQSEWDKGDKYDPDIDFDVNSYSRMDKFDGLEVGQEIIDSQLDASAKASAVPSGEEK